MSIYNTNLNELNWLLKELAYCRSQAEKYPPGYISSSKRKNGTAYFHGINGEKKYIPSDNQQLAVDLAIKTYFEKRIEDIEQEITAIRNYLKYHKDPKLDDYFESHKAIASLLPIGSQCFSDPVWLNQLARDPVAYQMFFNHKIELCDGRVEWTFDGSGKAPYQEKRTVRTLCGINVRSKSEAQIANELFKRNILFIYEPEVIIDGRKYYPDFYIFHPVRGCPVILEHGGMFADRQRLMEYNDEERKRALAYSSDFSYKIQHYINAGWIPGMNLLITSETKFEQFDMVSFSQMLDHFFE